MAGCLHALGWNYLSVIRQLSGVMTVFATMAVLPAADEPADRITEGLSVLYDLRVVEGTSVSDLSGNEPAINLQVADPGRVQQTADGLRMSEGTLLRSPSPATRLNTAISRSGALTVEVWVQSAAVAQSGPARVVTLSRNGNERNLTLGQDGGRWDFRLRTKGTSTNGIPSLASSNDSVRTERTHVVCTHSRTGLTRLFINGQLSSDRTVEGDLSGWDLNYGLGLGNEFSGDRPWQGTLLLVALYSRDLSAEEVRQNFSAGVPLSAESAAQAVARANIRMFENQVAPLLAKHCLECHDAASQQGQLDLSRKAMAFQGGESGVPLLPGNAADSLLWQAVASDQMPHDRPPLSEQEKRVLRNWLDDGGAWSLEVIDPAVYAQGSGSQAQFVQRLTNAEYIETVRSTLGVDISADARELLPPDVRADGFSNTAYNLTVDLGHIEAYARLAERIADQVDINGLVRKYTKSREFSDENLTKFIRPFGSIMLRGPISDDELRVYCGVSTGVAAAGGTFDEAVRFILEAMLQSPRFLYRIENQLGDGGRWPVSPYVLASRLAYIVWGAPPDEQLLTLAEKGQLDRQTTVTQLKRMLDDERAVRRSLHFVSEWLNLNQLQNLRPDGKHFPEWTPELANDMRRETLAFFEEIVWEQKRPLADLLNAQITFVTPRLAAHYRMPPPTNLPANAADDQLVRHDLRQIDGRGGLLTQGSVLTVGGDDASMVTRGLFVMHELLRGVVKDPPPCVDATPVPSQPGLTQRAVAESRLANSSCKGCHARFEPLSFGLEKFDGLGSWFPHDRYGNELREDGNILFPGQEQPVAFQSASELMNLLADSDRVRQSITWKVAQFAVGRPLGAADAAVMAEIHQTSQASGGTYADVLTAIILSDLVQMTLTESR